MILTRKALDRRTVLRGFGAALGLPLLDAMVPALAAKTKAPVRLGFVYVPNGIIDLNGEWTPKGEGPGFEFAPTMKPLEPFRDQLVVFSGLAQVNGRALGDGAGDHARAGATWLTGVHPRKTEGPVEAGPSADQIAARVLGQETELGSLEIGLDDPSLVGGCDSGYSCAYSNTVSWRTATTPIPMEVNPRTVFERLFGDGDSTDARQRRARLREEQSILDFARDDAARLARRVGPHDRTRIEEYLDAVRDVERRIAKARENGATAQIHSMERPSGMPDDFDEHARLMTDLFVLAFQADVTRVITFMIGREGSNRPYRAIGVADGHHSITHHQNDPRKMADTARINEHHARTFARLLERLQATPDGDGTLLDHAMLLYGSGLSDGNVHTHHDLPLVLAGGGGAIRGGRHLRYPSETPMTNLLVAMLDKARVPIDALGDSTGELAYLTGV